MCRARWTNSAGSRRPGRHGWPDGRRPVPDDVPGGSASPRRPRTSGGRAKTSGKPSATSRSAPRGHGLAPSKAQGPVDQAPCVRDPKDRPDPRSGAEVGERPRVDDEVGQVAARKSGDTYGFSHIDYFAAGDPDPAPRYRPSPDRTRPPSPTEASAPRAPRGTIPA